MKSQIARHPNRNLIVPMKLLFVCMGNICRSPSGENVMRAQLESAGLLEQFEIDSAGTIGYHTGNSPDARMTQAAEARGINMVGSARQVTSDDLKDFDWVFAMDHENFTDLKALEKTCPAPKAKIVMFCDFCEDHEEEEVPDPYYGGPEGFKKVLDLLEDGCDVFIRKFQEGTLEE